MTFVGDAARWVLGFVAALALTTILGTSAQAHFVLEGLGAAAGPVTLYDRLSMIWADLQGFGPRYAMLVGAASLITYGAATLLGRWLPAWRVAFLALAGAGAVLAVVMGLEAAFGQPVLKGAQGIMGLLAQGLAGAIGALAFVGLAPPKHLA
jgi:hypothetical protein